MTAQDPEQMAAEIMRFRHTDEEPPTDVVVNGVPIVVTEDSTVRGLAAQITNAQNQSG